MSARTDKELQDQFMDGCRVLVDYWAHADEPDILDRLSGLMHSMLTMIDGASSAFPCALDLVCRPHPDDKALYKADGEDWIEDGTVINASDLLHELLFHRGLWEES